MGLRAALLELREVAGMGGWPDVPPGPTLRPGDVGARVGALRERLRASGDLAPSISAAPAPDSVFDARLEEAVRRAQARHGLVVDGVAGPQTLRVLAVSVEDRIHQIEHNLEARRRFKVAPGRMHVLINVPAFEAWIQEEGGRPARHRVVVGRTDRRTPTLTGHIRHMVLAPYWTVPPGILRRDLLPQIRDDPATLARRRIRVLERSTGREVDVDEFNWDSWSAAALDARYLFRQDPGPWNALGRVKFIFPNPYLVYLHDTPDPHLFDAARRAFSSGCIRIEKAMTLAERIARAQLPEWTPDRLRAVASGGTERWISLPEPIPIQTVYWTAWVSPEGVLHFADDLYGWDPSPRAPMASLTRSH